MHYYVIFCLTLDMFRGDGADWNNDLFQRWVYEQTGNTEAFMYYFVMINPFLQQKRRR